MTTTTGKQDHFVDAIKNLIELEYDTQAIYKQVTNTIVNHDYKIKLNEFDQDHAYHIEKLSELLTNRKEKIPIMSGVIRPLINTMKVEFANLIGDRAKLSSILNNEVDVNKAYESMNARHDQWDEAKELLKQVVKDERSHKSWLEETIKSLD